MMTLSRSVMFYFAVVLLKLGVVSGLTMNASKEYQLRQYLFVTHPYDKTVRPIVNPHQSVEVRFSLRLSKVNTVNIKEQFMDVDAWVIQFWTNPYLVWNPSEYGGIRRLKVAPSQIWVPDIVLYNNVDKNTPMAGGSAKFLNPVTLFYTGHSIWTSTTTFKSSCTVDVSSWPFDKQNCSLLFGSLSQGKDELVIIGGDIKHRGEGFIESGEWTILSTTSEINETTLACCPFKFSKYNYTISLDRKSTYYLVYLVLPCTVLCLLTVMSFFIPSESGERIGFCITILLAMAVYLLLVAGSVPETSSHVPVLGSFFIMVFVEIFIALVATIIILRIYHSSDEPGPKWQKLFGCWRFCIKRPSVKPSTPKGVIQVAECDNLEMLPSKETAVSAPEVRLETEGDKFSWKDISVVMDRIMFFLALIYTVFIYAYLFKT